MILMLREIQELGTGRN